MARALALVGARSGRKKPGLLRSPEGASALATNGTGWNAAFSITERWFIEMQILRTGRRLHDPGQTLTARGPVPDERH
ncbi:MAG TPA: hypothetical protein DCE36_14945 [Pseudomonas sp.]|nr:hypothetical protein [Pseudomonas sp.]